MYAGTRGDQKSISGPWTWSYNEVMLPNLSTGFRTMIFWKIRCSYLLSYFSNLLVFLKYNFYDVVVPVFSNLFLIKMDYICSKKSFIKEKLRFSYIDTVWVCKFSVLTVPTISLKYFLNHKVRIFYVIIILFKFVFF